MATDSSELTFVRCPSCRSLVPAVSQRCRMCGAGLDASQKVEEDKEKKSSGRVRQRTLSVSSSELAAAAGLLKEEASANKATEPQKGEDVPSPNTTSADAGDLDDPLSAYIEEVEVPVAGPANENGTNHGAVDAVAASSERSGEKKASPAAAESSQKPRVIIESGSRRSNRPSNLSFGKQPEASRESATPQKTTSAQTKQEMAATPPPPSAGKAVDSGWQSATPEKSTRGELVKEPPRGDTNRQERSEVARQGQSPSAKKEDTRSTSGSGKAKSSDLHFDQPSSGRLSGWLVSFVDPKGSAIELREGRFFVTGASLKPSDLVLEDDSISTPHALVAVSVHEGMRVQDLMSDRGVWVRRRGSDGYQRVSETARIEHGDWIRFGEVEFLASFLAAQTNK